MKSLFRKSLAICMAIFSTSINNKASAQDLIAANNPDTTLTAVTLIGSDLNSAIYYGANVRLFGATWRDGAGNVHFTVRDNSQYVASMPFSLTPPMGSFYYGADMVIGSPYNLSDQYFVGIVYTQSTASFPFSGDILMDVYKIQYLSGTPTVVGQNTQITLATGIGMHNAFPHIDLINKQSGSNWFSDKFVVGWTTQSGASAEACSGSLIDVFNNGNTNIVYASTTINDVSNVPAGFEYQSDITGIERVIGGLTKDLAYMIFTDANGNPYISLWNITDNTVTWNNTPIDNTVPAYDPRIDGLDPYTQAANGDPYCAVWSYNIVGIRQIKSYALTNGLVTNTATAYNTTDFISTSNAIYPSVACSPNGYTVAFYSQGGNVVLESMDFYNNFDNNCTCTTSTNQDYFQVNATNGTPQHLYVANASAWLYNSGSGNVEPVINMLAWSDENPTFSYNLNYKRFSSLTTNPFKQANSVNNTGTDGKLAISPNPVSDKLEIKGLDDGTAYNITDITGREVQSGNIKASGIHINSLAPGVYILNAGDENVKFVKE